MKIFGFAVVAYILAFGTQRAGAVPLYYDVGPGSTINANSGSGLEIDWALAPTLQDQAFTLDDGQSFTFKFFDLWTEEGYVNPDDTVTKPIGATLSFTVPSIDAEITGGTVGISFFGIIQAGVVIWENPAPTFTAGNRTFSVDLSDSAFNLGFFGLNAGERYGASIDATVTQISSVAVTQTSTPVPDSGATLILLGLGLCAAGALRGFPFGFRNEERTSPGAQK